MRKIFMILASCMLISSCSTKTVDLKSPCVGGDGSPCVRRAVNLDQA